MKPCHFQPGPGSILENKLHLEERRTISHPRRVHGLHHAIEGQVLMKISFEGNSADTRQYLAESRVAGKIGAQRHLVHEEPNQLFRFCGAAIGQVRSHHQVVLPNVVMHQDIECAQQGHEHGAAFTIAEQPELLDEFRRERHCDQAAISLHGVGTGRVCR